MKTQIIAHRGASAYYPENTMIAFEEAYRMGADGIELDVQFTKDHIPVVIHDKKINRTTNGKGFVHDYTFQELQQFDAGAWFGDQFSGERIPSLHEVLSWVKQTSMVVHIELKLRNSPNASFEQLVANAIDDHKLQERVVISSFNHYSLVAMKHINPRLETAILVMELLYMPWEYAKRVGAQGLHCHERTAFKEIVHITQMNGIAVRPFTIKSEERMKELIDIGCAAFFTDYPDLAKRLVSMI